ncbi:hypothetical protein U472_05755 [Orenia metallireducens]|uniref:DUF3866 domain-containing protein n=1 Tax=Orenia metallireducens TaxID=1413210 RepID=A0A1C0A9L5_9FIRM|nr:DUF3866 family protein [Orenia metallireducens]OCL26990.1 hypothetical protein U472_05755 [Orenia metallireducens]
MIEIRQGKVIEILSQRDGLTIVRLEIEGKEKKGISYDDLVGEIREGDDVVVNTTATSLNLGTGGYDFIICILNHARERDEKGHIMKMRYTPYQIQTFSTEEQDSPYHERINNFHSLSGTPVVVGTLHSMLAPITVMAKAISPKAKITYIMTDGAALPIRFSNMVHFLKSEGIINNTVTIGHAFGGDLEAVNIYSGLISAYEVSEADIIVVCMGPGIVGTGTKYGFTGVEQANILNAVYQLGGSPIGVPRIGFGDRRERHYGLSHHSRTTLGELTMVESKVGLPYLDRKRAGVIKEQLVEAGINNKHQIIYREGDRVLKELERLDFTFKTMGRGLKEEKEYFMTAGVAGILASEEIGKDGSDG